MGWLFSNSNKRRYCVTFSRKRWSVAIGRQAAYLATDHLTSGQISSEPYLGMREKSKMLTLTHSRLDFSSSSTVVEHLKRGAGGALPLDGEERYRDLWLKVGTSKPFSEITGREGRVLGRLNAASHVGQYWSRLFETNVFPDRAKQCWLLAVGIEGELKSFFELDPEALAAYDLNLKAQVSIKPRLLLFPFGWSLWLSVRVVGQHSLSELASLLHALLKRHVFRVLNGPENLLDMSGLSDLIGPGLWEDAFLGADTNERRDQESLSIATVLEKFGGAPPKNSASTQFTKPLSSIIDLSGSELPSQYADSLPKGSNPSLDYLLGKDLHYFIWAEHLLTPFENPGIAFSRLRNYHNNTFRALNHARHLQRFLARLPEIERMPPELLRLAENACDLLDPAQEVAGRYRCRASVSFRERVDVRQAVTEARALIAKNT